MWQIIVIMMVALGADTDALEITHNNGKPLQFETQEICYDHVYENLEPGTFMDVFFQLTLDDTIYHDTIQIFTRIIFPITEFTSRMDEVIEKNGYWDENEQFTDGNQIYDDGKKKDVKKFFA